MCRWSLPRLQATSGRSRQRLWETDRKLPADWIRILRRGAGGIGAMPARSKPPFPRPCGNREPTSGIFTSRETRIEHGAAEGARRSPPDPIGDPRAETPTDDLGQADPDRQKRSLGRRHLQQIPAAFARRRIMSQASDWFIGRADSASALWPRAVRNNNLADAPALNTAFAAASGRPPRRYRAAEVGPLIAIPGRFGCAKIS